MTQIFNFKSFETSIVAKSFGKLLNKTNISPILYKNQRKIYGVSLILLSYICNFSILYKNQRKIYGISLILQENVILEFYTKTRDFFFPTSMEIWFFFKSMYPAGYMEFGYFFFSLSKFTRNCNFRILYKNQRILLSYFSNFRILHKKPEKKFWKPLDLQEIVILPQFWTRMILELCTETIEKIMEASKITRKKCNFIQKTWEKCMEASRFTRNCNFTSVLNKNDFRALYRNHRKNYGSL